MSMPDTLPSMTLTFGCARQDAADRRGDIGGRQPGGRDLIEQRLEQVIVVLVDDGDVERLVRPAPWRRTVRRSRLRRSRRGLVMTLPPLGPHLIWDAFACFALQSVIAGLVDSAKRTANGDGT
jgi:hypothetical protein